MVKFKALLKTWSGTFIFIFLLFAFRSVVADWYQVPTGSMKPTIIEGDRIFVNKLAYDVKVPFTLISLVKWDHPQRGDVVVFDSPTEPQRLVKRVVGLPGDTVMIRDNQLFINNKPAHYQAVDQSKVSEYWDITKSAPVLISETFEEQTPHTITWQPFRQFIAQNYGPVKVPAAHYFMLGDNRDNSADSRFIGAVHEKYILGKANAVVLSLSHLDRFLLHLN
ncbi:MAG: signal peptidase I [Gammaproteobacteria bacterium]|jgi:signal peptidase I|nr:signal peptidase I [Gammaproteobacteria bacterium]